MDEKQEKWEGVSLPQVGTTANGLMEAYELNMISLKGLFWMILRSITAHLSAASMLHWSRKTPSQGS